MPHLPFLAGVALALAAPGALAGSSQTAEGRAQPAEHGYYIPYLTGPAGERRKATDVPGSVTIVSRKFMDDIQARSVGEALRSVPGVQTMGR